MLRMPLLIVVMAVIVPSFGKADFIVTLDAPRVQATTLQQTSVTTESFDGLKTGTYSSLQTSVGVVTSTGGQFAVVGHNDDGGAGGTGNYISLGAQSASAAPAVLTLNKPAAYFGFWWSAADRFNQVSFYSGDAWLGSLNTAILLTGYPITLRRLKMLSHLKDRSTKRRRSMPRCVSPTRPT